MHIMNQYYDFTDVINSIQPDELYVLMVITNIVWSKPNEINAPREHF